MGDKTMKILFLLVISFIYTSALEIDTKTAWTNFKKYYNKTYEPQDESCRFKIFEENVLFVIRHNLEADLRKHTYFLKVNRFADLTNKEFNEKYNQLEVERDVFDASITYDSCASKVIPPDSLDYRDLKMVTAVGDQGDCGNSHVFAAIGTLEAAWKNSTGDLVQLSKKNVMDCSKTEKSKSCRGGSIVDVYNYVMENNGINTVKTYSKVNVTETCKFQKKSAVASITGYKKLMTGTELELKEALVSVGPIAVGVNANMKAFQFYSYGVFFEKCCEKTVNHAMLCVGYGQEDGEKYWILKNSWSERWGEDGYMKLARGKDNVCGIATYGFFPLLKKS